MDFANFNWYSVVSTILWVVLGFLVSYFKTKTNLVDKAKDAINYAESQYTDKGAGEDRMNWCIRYLNGIIPAPMKFIFNDEVLRQIIQAVFDKLQDFANKQLDKVIDKIPKD